VRSDGPSGKFIFTAKVNIVKMVASLNPGLSPFTTTVFGDINTAACSDNYGISGIANKNTAKRLVFRQKLPLPRKTAVSRMKYRVVRTDSKTAPFVIGEIYRIDRISLRQRILPDPSTAELCRTGSCGHNKNRGHERDGRSIIQKFVRPKKAHKFRVF